MNFAHIFDIGAACALAFFVVRGVLRGLTGEVISLLGLVTSVFCSWAFSQSAADTLLTYFPTWNRTFAELGSSIFIFMAVSLVFAAVGKLLRVIVKAANLSLVDHIAGAVSGMARTFCIVLFIYGVVYLFPVIPSAWMKESLTMQGAAVVWPPVFKLLTDRGWINLEHLNQSKIIETQIIETKMNVPLNSLSMPSSLTLPSALSSSVLNTGSLDLGSKKD